MNRYHIIQNLPYGIGEVCEFTNTVPQTEQIPDARTVLMNTIESNRKRIGYSPMRK